MLVSIITVSAVVTVASGTMYALGKVKSRKNDKEA